MRAIALPSTLQSADIVLPTNDGREIRLRRITEPTAEHRSLLQQLGLNLPEHLLFNRECTADSAIARTGSSICGSIGTSLPCYLEPSSKLKPGDDLAGSRSAERRPGVDVSKASRSLTCRIPGLRCRCARRRGIVRLRPIEDVRELRASRKVP